MIKTKWRLQSCDPPMNRSHFASVPVSVFDIRPCFQMGMSGSVKAHPKEKCPWYWEANKQPLDWDHPLLLPDLSYFSVDTHPH